MTLTLSDLQARVLVAALDAYSRLQAGQLWVLADVLEAAKDREGAPLKISGWDLREKWTDPMMMDLFGYHPAASHGIHSPKVPESAKIAWDLQQVIRQDKTVFPSSKEPLAIIQP